MIGILKLANKYKRATYSDDIQYALSNDLHPLDLYRPGSAKWCEVVRELKDSNIDLDEDAKEAISECDAGYTDFYEGNLVPLDFPILDEEPLSYSDYQDVNNAEYQGKEVELGKPKRGGSRKFYVYVRDPKTKKVKKVSFGDPGMSMKISDPKRRSSFVARHRCEQKNDKTTAGYWSCRIGRYPNLTGAKTRYTWW